MTEQIHLPISTRLARQIADQEGRSAHAWAARETELKAMLGQQQAAAANEKAELRRELEEYAAKIEARYAELDAETQRLSGEVADAGRRRERHTLEADEARHSVADWCTRNSIDPAALPALPAAEGTGPLPAIPGPQAVVDGRLIGQEVVVNTHDRRWLRGVLDTVTNDEVRLTIGAEGVEGIPLGAIQSIGAADSSSPMRAVTSGGQPIPTADQIREQHHLPPRGEQRPVQPDPGMTQAWRPADIEQPDSPDVTRGDLTPGGEAPEASFHRGDPDTGGETDA